MSDTQDAEENDELESPVGGVKAEEGIDTVGEIVAHPIEKIYTPPQPKTQSKSASIEKIQKSIADISKEMEKQMSHIDKINQAVQTLQKQTKSGQRQSDVLDQIRSQVYQLQRQVAQVQKVMQRRAVVASSRKSVKKKTVRKHNK
jgi:methyl-accepting chemotaxis protein